MSESREDIYGEYKLMVEQRAMERERKLDDARLQHENREDLIAVLEINDILPESALRLIRELLTENAALVQERDNWREDARRYAQNAGFWEDKLVAQAALLREARQVLARWIPPRFVSNTETAILTKIDAALEQEATT